MFNRLRKPKAQAVIDRRVDVALFGDTHGANDHGLLSPDTKLPKFDSKGVPYYFTPQQNEIQRYLWELYIYQIDQIFDRAGESEVVPEHDGDIGQGMKHLDEMTMTLVVGYQKAIAEANMRPWLVRPNVKKMRVIEGTSAHEMTGNSMSYMVASQLQAEYPDKDIKAVPHALIDIDGFEIDASHHGPPPGSRAWLKGNEARYYLRDRMMKEIIAGRKPPDLYHRAHYHEPVIEELRINGCHSIIVITPSFSFPGAWGRQATRSISEIVNGMMTLEIVNGKLMDIHEYIERTDIRTREAL